MHREVKLSAVAKNSVKNKRTDTPLGVEFLGEGRKNTVEDGLLSAISGLQKKNNSSAKVL
jgi:hypothetical protein